MKKRIYILGFLLVGLSLMTKAQSIYKTSNPAEADLKVFLCDSLTEPDLTVCYVGESKDAHGNKGHWYLETDPAKADYKIFITGSLGQADLLIYTTANLKGAGWINNNKKSLLQNNSGL